MLKKLFHNQPPTSTPDKGEIIPDPWEETTSVDKPESMAEGWAPAVEIHPLIVGEQQPQAVSLPIVTGREEISPVQVLLQDALKVKAYDGGVLKIRLEEALGLLSWMAMGTPGYAG
ncbi:MAG: hypothetical protein QNJ47_17180 [Nostocaceae cyanobacterium]|nr:hypothetical protein [Nostocaceae cyanobacterium]